MKLIATTEVRYGGRTYLKGEPFTTASERDGQLLKILRKAEDAPPAVRPAHAAIAPVEPRALQPEASAAAPPAIEPPAEPPEPPARSRTYRRRDMKAEG